MIRVYGLGTEAIIDRSAELENMQQLAQLGEGSQLFAAFNNGIAYEFVPGQLLTQQMTQDPAVYR
jgi:ethanolamine kinase